MSLFAASRDPARAAAWLDDARVVTQARGDWPDEVVKQWAKAWASRLD